MVSGWRVVVTLLATLTAIIFLFFLLVNIKIIDLNNYLRHIVAINDTFLVAR
jgi:hypothetical protein